MFISMLFAITISMKFESNWIRRNFKHSQENTILRNQMFVSTVSTDNTFTFECQQIKSISLSIINNKLLIEIILSLTHTNTQSSAVCEWVCVKWRMYWPGNGNIVRAHIIHILSWANINSLPPSLIHTHFFAECLWMKKKRLDKFVENLWFTFIHHKIILEYFIAIAKKRARKICVSWFMYITSVWKRPIACKLKQPNCTIMMFRNHFKESPM